MWQDDYGLSSESVLEELREIESYLSESYDNLSEGLRMSENGMMMEERIEA